MSAKVSSTVIPFQNAQSVFSMIGFFVTQDFPEFRHSSTFSVSPAQLNKCLAQHSGPPTPLTGRRPAPSPRGPPPPSPRAEVCLALQNTSFDQARLQCCLSHSWYHAPHFGSIGRSAGMLGYRLWLHSLSGFVQQLVVN